MRTIDGSRGEGGGQILRTSLALAAVTGEAVCVERVRAGRPRSGLARQHLAAVQAVSAICGGRLRGAALGSQRIEFEPGQVRPGGYTFAVGSAGSATLVLQTVLPALLLADGPSQLVLEGGTHNPWAPPYDFLEKVYLPLLCRMGPQVMARLERPGFYPAGGGRFLVTIVPRGPLEPLSLVERGPIVGRRVRAAVSKLPKHVAQRELARIAERTGWDRSCFEPVEELEAAGPGNVVQIELVSEQLTELFTGFGRKGVKAERVADEVVREAEAYLAADVPVGPHLADQLLLLLGLAARGGRAGGRFRTTPLTLHGETHTELLEELLEVKIRVEPAGEEVEVRFE